MYRSRLLPFSISTNPDVTLYGQVVMHNNIAYLSKYRLPTMRNQISQIARRYVQIECLAEQKIILAPYTLIDGSIIYEPLPEDLLISETSVASSYQFRESIYYKCKNSSIVVNSTGKTQFSMYALVNDAIEDVLYKIIFDTENTMRSFNIFEQTTNEFLRSLMYIVYFDTTNLRYVITVSHGKIERFVDISEQLLLAYRNAGKAVDVSDHYVVLTHNQIRRLGNVGIHSVLTDALHRQARSNRYLRQCILDAYYAQSKVDNPDDIMEAIL